jgi:hypothetical protein
MKELRTSQSMEATPSNEVKTSSIGYTNSNGSREINHQRVSVREIIVDHYRRGK